MNQSLDLALKQEILGTLRQYMNKAKALKVDHIGYREFYDDGSSMAFCSNDEWYNVLLDEEMSTDMSMHYADELISISKTGFNCIIRTATSTNNRFLKELLERDMCNSLLIYKKDKNVICMYSFIFYISNVVALTYFFNKRELFELLVDLYKDELRYIFKKEEYQQLRQPLFSKKMVSQIFSQRYVDITANKFPHLTRREIEYMPLLVKGATNKDLALKFNISPRTAQYHVTNIKKKLQVNRRFKIGEVAEAQLNF